jgi:LysR family nitrogen assimilation transcriptional regulator
MDLRQLRYFVAIVELGSFSKAASALNIAQPALSLHVRNMEADLQVQLLFRSPQGVVATEAGEILLRNARIIIDQFSVAEEEIRGFEAEPSGEVRLGLPGTIGQILAVPLIMAARKRFPKIRLRIAEAMSGFVLDWMRDGRVDLGVLYNAVDDRGLASCQVLTEELCLLGPPEPLQDIELPPGDILAYAHIARLPLILPSINHGLRTLIEREAAQSGLNINTVLEVDSYSNIKELVEEGMGYSILPYNSVDREVKEGRLIHRGIAAPVLKRDVHVVHNATRPMTNAVAAIEQLCRSTLLSLVETGRWNGARAFSSAEMPAAPVFRGR